MPSGNVPSILLFEHKAMLSYLLGLELVVNLAWSICGLDLVLREIVEPEYQILIGILELLVNEAGIPKCLLPAQ